MKITSHHGPTRRVAGMLGALTLALGLTACGSTDEKKDDAGTSGIRIVASTGVWGAVAKEVAGEHAGVVSIVDAASGDPHSFEVSPADAARISDADIVLVNGGGYDTWASDAAKNGKQKQVIDAYSLVGTNENLGHGDHAHDHGAPGDTQEKQPTPGHEGHEGHDHGTADHDHAGHDHGTTNEHVWYDPDVVDAVAGKLAEALAEKDPANAETYLKNRTAFHTSLHDIVDIMADVKKKHPGATYVQSEPVADALLALGGLTDRTPAKFLEAIHLDNDPSAADITAVTSLLENTKVDMFVYNTDTKTPATEKLAETAKKSGVPVVPATESIPEGKGYVEWMSDNAKAIAAALSR